MIQPEIVERLKANSDFLVFKKHVEAAIESLDKCSSIDSMADYDKESRGRAHAVKIVGEVLAPFYRRNEEQQESPEGFAKRKHGLE